MTAFPDADPATFLDLAKERLDRQLTFADSLDGKLAGTIGWATGGLSVLAAVIALRPHAAGRAGVIVLSIGAFMVYIAISVAVLVATRQQKWGTAPQIEAVYAAYLTGRADDEIRWDLAMKYAELYKANEIPYGTKTRCLAIAMCSLVAQTVAVLAALVLIAFH